MNRKTAAFYNYFSFLYPIVDVFLKPQKTILFKEVNAMPNGKLLEIGVGNGVHFKHYKKHEITGIDTSATMLKIARKNRFGNVSLLEMSGEAIQFSDEEFDYIVLSHVIAVVDNPQLLLTEAYRVLKPGGQIFILNHFTTDNWLRYVDHSLRQIAKLLHFKSIFRIEDIPAIEKFELRKQINLGVASYFKLLIYQKP
ncbi:class I SAM-dependent methyltransferase [Mucilaginibacter terrae]|uniref:Phosphatidylethanolamine/phosphatidyl-N-methylethanolamine N-methyltransferase n=1 Tax=Mucilaginibacter terrae TaxID=1955052 RepID=A0ABU3GRF0_9SPHI|nr:methyltransferase domain-containing protein [Mucilaginibacter terrae]MDT3402362.1 phosphatidylethanolamine/phosphatidyl-N-methylethanolamine N-methyltransferase [Mucilaginibacter terrae]